MKFTRVIFEIIFHCTLYIACHPKCRNCLDTSSDDKCLSCSSGYLLPYIGTLFGPCVENCPDQYYLMESGICGS